MNIQGMFHRDLASIWPPQPVTVFIYLCLFLSDAGVLFAVNRNSISGIGLLL